MCESIEARRAEFAWNSLWAAAFLVACRPRCDSSVRCEKGISGSFDQDDGGEEIRGRAGCGALLQSSSCGLTHQPIRDMTRQDVRQYSLGYMQTPLSQTRAVELQCHIWVCDAPHVGPSWPPNLVRHESRHTRDSASIVICTSYLPKGHYKERFGDFMVGQRLQYSADRAGRRLISARRMRSCHHPYSSPTEHEGPADGRRIARCSRLRLQKQRSLDRCERGALDREKVQGPSILCRSQLRDQRAPPVCAALARSTLSTD